VAPKVSSHCVHVSVIAPPVHRKGHPVNGPQIHANRRITSASQTNKLTQSTDTEHDMGINPTYRTAQLAGGTAVTILTAPMSLAAPTLLRDCAVTGAESTYQSLGNVEFTGSRPMVDFYR
jgi:hypothetical protein